MRGEREKDCEALMSAYGLGRRLATRVVALLARKVDVTGTLLSEAARDGAAERLLLWPDLLRRPEKLDEAALRAKAAELGFGEAELLRLVVDRESGWRTLALEDDLLAEQAASAADEAERMGLIRARGGQISLRETEKLFSREQVAQLKLTALTSQDVDERIECMRKLVFAPMEGAQKAAIFLGVLTDREAEAKVRREAVRALEQIGLRSDMAEAVRGLFEPESEDATYAIQRLGALLREAEAGEAAVVLAVVLEVFEQSRSASTVRELLRLVARSADVLVTNPQKTEQFLQSALRHLARDFEGMRAEVAGAIGACARQAPDRMAELIWTELERSEDARVRGLLLNLSEGLSRTPERTAELARRAVAEILNPALPESERARLRYGLVRLGEPAAAAVLARIPRAAGSERTELVRLIDVLCTEGKVSSATVQKGVRALLDLLKLADTSTRRMVVQSAVLAEPRVKPTLRRQMAGELLALMSELNLPDSLDMIQNALERIGPEAVGPAYEFMRRSYPSEPASRAALVIARSVEANPGAVDAALARRILALGRKLLKDTQLKEGAFTIALAAVCGYTEPGAEHFEPVLRALVDGLGKSPYSMEALEALGIMGGSPNAAPAHQEELLGLFEAIVSFQGHTGMGRRKQTETGTVYEFGREIEFDIRAVPAAVRGLERICVGPSTPQRIRTEIVKRLLVLWEGVSKVRIVWGPAAIEALVHAMSSAARSPAAATLSRVRLGESLLRFLNKISVVRSIGRICSRPDPDPQMRAFCIQAGRALVDEWQQCDPQDEERKLELLKSAGQVAANPSLEADDEAVRNLRERTLQALFSGLREGMHQVREPLTLMRDCAGLSRAQKREIDERLAKAFGLVPIGSRRRRP